MMRSDVNKDLENKKELIINQFLPVGKYYTFILDWS